MARKKNNRLLFVNYHYIGESSRYPYPGIHPISRHAFIEQVNDLRRRFHVATPAQVEAFAAGEKALPGPSIFLTFDDGLAEHTEIASGILDPLGIKAAFFIPSRPLLDRRAAMVHKVHWLRATTPPERFREEFLASLSGKHPGERQDPATVRAALETYPYDTPAAARLKYLINFQLDSEFVDEITSQMLMDRAISEADFCREFYMDESAVRALAEAGHVIGAHGHSHRAFSILSQRELEADIRTNLDYLGKLTGRQPTWVSYPYGSDESLPEDTDGFCRRHGFRIALTLSRAWNESGESPFRLKRINTNEVLRLAA